MGRRLIPSGARAYKTVGAIGEGIERRCSTGALVDARQARETVIGVSERLPVGMRHLRPPPCAIVGVSQRPRRPAVRARGGGEVAKAVVRVGDPVRTAHAVELRRQLTAHQIIGVINTPLRHRS